MKLTWRIVLMAILTVLAYFILYSRFDTKFIHTSSLELKATKARKKPSYKERRALIKRRLNRLIVTQNITDLLRKTTKKKYTKPINNDNYRLSRLLYQLWDPNNYQNQGNMLSCDNLVSVDDKKYRQGRRFARKLNRKFYEYVNVSDIWETIKHSCISVKNVFRYRTPKYGPSSYPIAYTITLDRTAEQSFRMLASIYDHDNIYCIHPNAKFGIPYLSVFKRLSECVPNIILPDKIFSISSGKMHNRLKAELTCFQKLLNSTVPWRYGINLPGSAFPLRNNTFIVHYLKNKPYENVVAWDFPSERFIRRVKYVHVIRETEGERLLLRTSTLKKLPPDNIVIFRKGDYFISTRDFYNYLTESETPKNFLEWAEDTKSPEDFYYASLHRHKSAPGGLPYDPESEEPRKMRQTETTEIISDIPPSDLLVGLWKTDGAHRCHGQYRGHICIFGAADLRWLMEQDNLFAYSFDFRVDRVAIDCLTKNLKEPILDDLTLDYKEIPLTVL